MRLRAVISRGRKCTQGQPARKLESLKCPSNVTSTGGIGQRVLDQVCVGSPGETDVPCTQYPMASAVEVVDYWIDHVLVGQES